MEELASRYSRPRVSRRTAPWPDSMTIGSRFNQSRICVNGCQTYFLSSAATSGMLGLGNWARYMGERVEQGIQIGRRVCGGKSQTQSGLAARDGRIADGRNKYSFRAQFCGSSHGAGFITDNQRNYRTLHAREIPAEIREAHFGCLDNGPEIADASFSFRST